MNECYKCGRDLPGIQKECETILTPEQIVQAVEDFAANSVSVDWDKIKTIEDMKLILQTFLFDDRVQRGSLAYHKLRKFLKEKNPHD